MMQARFLRARGKNPKPETKTARLAGEGSLWYHDATGIRSEADVGGQLAREGSEGEGT